MPFPYVDLELDSRLRLVQSLVTAKAWSCSRGFFQFSFPLYSSASSSLSCCMLISDAVLETTLLPSVSPCVCWLGLCTRFHLETKLKVAVLKISSKRYIYWNFNSFPPTWQQCFMAEDLYVSRAASLHIGMISTVANVLQVFYLIALFPPVAKSICSS